MYRPPEMLDQYSKFDIDFKADIWMIGCILYTLCYAKHPFMDAQKLAIINGQFTIPVQKKSLNAENSIIANLENLIKVLL